MEGWVREVRQAARGLIRRPAFSALVVATLGLGIGANTALFSVVRAVVLAPLPYPASGRLMNVTERVGEDGRVLPSTSLDTYREWRAGAATFDILSAAAVFQSVIYTGSDEALRLRADLVTPSFLEVLGATTSIGRLFRPDEGEQLAGDFPVAVLSHGLWLRVFGGDPDVIGRSVTLSGHPYTVVGVLDPGFHDPLPAGFPADVYLPVTEMARIVGPASMEGRQARQLLVVGRLRPDATVERAQAELDGVMAGIRSAEPEAMRDIGVSIRSLRERLAGDLDAPVLALLAGAALLLVAACANVAGLMQVRAARQARDVAVRRAMGAPPRLIARGLVLEALLLAAGGGVVGIALASWTVEAIVRLNADLLPTWTDVALNPTVVTLAVLLSTLTGVAYGLLPARRAARIDVRAALAADDPRAGGSRSGRARHALVVLEVATATVLVVGSGLMVRSFRALAGTDLGFRTEGVASAMVTLRPERYPTPEEMDSFHSALVDSLEARPDVEWAGLWAAVRPGQARQYQSLVAEGMNVASRSEAPVTRIHAVTPGLLEAMEIPLLAGRGFNAADQADTPPVVIVSRGLARTLFGDADPIGRRVRHFVESGQDPTDAPWYEVVGVVGDTELGGRTVTGSFDVPHDLYFPITQPSRVLKGYLVMLAGARGDPAAVGPSLRAALHGVDPDVPAFAVTPLGDAVEEELASSRLVAVLMAIFGGLSLSLAMLGIYGVLSQSVSARRREVGLRAALGARPADTMWLVVGQTLRMALLGVALGVGAALGLARFADSLLYGIAPHDPLSLTLAATALLSVALLAAWFPVRQALGVSPVVALGD